MVWFDRFHRSVCYALFSAPLALRKKVTGSILVIWGDDIGWFNVSMNNHGMMGYKTPNIDRIAKEDSD